MSRTEIAYALLQGLEQHLDVAQGIRAGRAARPDPMRDWAAGAALSKVFAEMAGELARLQDLDVPLPAQGDLHWLLHLAQDPKLIQDERTTLSELLGRLDGLEAKAIPALRAEILAEGSAQGGTLPE